MLVDDERLALEGLRLLIDWQAEGFAVCAQCDSAAQALSALRAAAPDLIVTDIRMPGMDGLALMCEARAHGFTGQLVVVSGYGDFEYAQRALRLGVAGYLLKPIDPQEAASVLEHVRKMLVSREAGDAGGSLTAGRALTSLLQGQSASADSFPHSHRWKLASWGAPLPYEAVREVLAALPEGAASTHIVGDKEYLALHWPKGEAEPSLAAALAALTALRPGVVQSALCDDPFALPAQREALAQHLNETAETLAARTAELLRAVALRDAEACARRSAELEALCDACGAQAREREQRTLVCECSRLLAQKPAALAELLAAQETGFLKLCQLTIRLLAPMQDLVSDRVITYVEPRLAEALTLEDVAMALGYNATYLGRLFREERGLGFRDWLNGRRVERAARLLVETDKAVCVIAEQVGYRHYKRFLEHFKRRYGKTPERYRLGGNRKGS